MEGLRGGEFGEVPPLNQELVGGTFRPSRGEGLLCLIAPVRVDEPSGVQSGLSGPVCKLGSLLTLLLRHKMLSQTWKRSSHTWNGRQARVSSDPLGWPAHA